MNQVPRVTNNNNNNRPGLLQLRPLEACVEKEYFDKTVDFAKPRTEEESHLISRQYLVLLLNFLLGLAVAGGWEF